ncbi:hypothetical protein MEE_00039 [Bartonella elizabethae F9251 = ATCC 49927]|uniref:Uncharacterized protein n=1 Tax=Bartonella elizabethae F9251 = ATCC 49927 TaxID=1094555 RepID=J0RF48_BAREL|nr:MULTISPECIES: hypothetical protein [Bartonella]EJF97411.1 hypothetical protein MEE_00039 [Bartonella elizabethae F9251 = ATCC 49927]VEJ42013.1 Uncharacterised protein [Bartonella elizabethae]
MNCFKCQGFIATLRQWVRAVGLLLIKRKDGGSMAVYRLHGCCREMEILHFLQFCSFRSLMEADFSCKAEHSQSSIPKKEYHYGYFHLIV